MVKNYRLWRPSLETDNRFLPFARRADIILRPFLVAILALNPCLFRRLRSDG